MNRTPRQHWPLVGGVVIVVAIAWRLLFLKELPFTADESSYLYDASTLLAGRIPAGDALTKSPVALLAISLGVFISKHSLYAGRLAALIASLLTALPINYLATRLVSRPVGTLAAVIWLFSIGVASITTLGQTESFAALAAVTALALWLATMHAKTTKAVWRTAFAAGAVAVVAFATRKTAIVLPIPMLVLLIQQRPPHWRHMVSASVTGAAVVALIWSAFVVQHYGTAGFQQASGLGYVAITVQHVANGIDSWGAGASWVVNTALRTAPIVALLTLLFIGVSIETIARQAKLPQLRPVGYLTAAIVTTIAGIFLLRTSHDILQQLLGDSYIVIGIATILLLAYRIPQARLPLTKLIWIISWPVSLAILYSLWPTFLPDYLAEFMPALIVLGSSALAALTTPQSVIKIATGAALITGISAASLIMHPWVGLYTADGVRAAAALVRQHVPANQPILTAAGIIAYAADRQLLFDNAHPLWYRYKFITNDTKNRFLPPLKQVSEALRDGSVTWVVTDELTAYAYQYLDPPLPHEPTDEWELIATTVNDTGERRNPVTLWQHHSPTIP